jgi:uncharacterized protein (TIGR03032 family)
LHNFKRAMGVALGDGRLALGTTEQVWQLGSAAQIAPQLDPDTAYDACFLTRGSWFTGEIQAHEMAWIDSELWVVNTLFSCLCTLDDQHSFVPRWRPQFISALAAEDRCHLNGLAVDGGKPRFVTVLGETDTPAGWRPEKASGGCLIDVEANQVVVRGLAMPHSPRIHHGRVWLLNSGEGQLVEANPATCQTTTIADLSGYARGLALHSGLAFIGLSRIRERSAFSGLPLDHRSEELKCGVAIVELASGRIVAQFEFCSGVEEIFDVQLIQARLPAIYGPFAHEEGQKTIWVVPAESANAQVAPNRKAMPQFG